MIPHARLDQVDSSTPLELLYPDSLFNCHRPYEDYEYGSLALQDPTGGLQQAVWQAKTDGSAITLQRLPDGLVEPLAVSSGFVTEVSLAFDSDMYLYLAWVEDDVVRLSWRGQSLVLEDAYSPRLTLDDKRPGQELLRDVLLFYLRNLPGEDLGEGVPPALCYRQQREQFSVERVLARISPIATGLGAVGMNTEHRLQISFCGCMIEVSTLLPTNLYPLEASDRLSAGVRLTLAELVPFILEEVILGANILSGTVVDVIKQISVHTDDATLGANILGGVVTATLSAATADSDLATLGANILSGNVENTLVLYEHPGTLETLTSSVTVIDATLEVL